MSVLRSMNSMCTQYLCARSTSTYSRLLAIVLSYKQARFVQHALNKRRTHGAPVASF